MHFTGGVFNGNNNNRTKPSNTARPDNRMPFGKPNLTDIHTKDCHNPSLFLIKKAAFGPTTAYDIDKSIFHQQQHFCSTLFTQN
jgi:hypothetical protein